MSDPLTGTGLSIGDVLLGKYRIDRALGRGGMGFVVAATHLGLDQPVAIKMLLPIYVQRADIVARFSREARAAARLKSDNVVRVTDVGALDDGSPYMVMEYLAGRDLEALLADRGALPIAEAVDRVIEACQALAEAHARGVIHRDLKPSNLFLARRADGTEILKLLDFGISKAESSSERDELSLTGSDVFIGSPRYVSPEQLRSARDVDARTDIWSLGVILHQLLSGTLPFDGDTAPSLIAQISSDPPIPIQRAREGVPNDLAQAIARCLEKDRARRFASVGELARALAPHATPSEIQGRLERIERGAVVTADPIGEADQRPYDPTEVVRRTRTQSATEPPAPEPLQVALAATHPSLVEPMGATIARRRSVPRPLVVAAFLACVAAGALAFLVFKPPSAPALPPKLEGAVPNVVPPPPVALSPKPADPPARVESSTAAKTRESVPAVSKSKPKKRKSRDPLDVNPY